MVVKGGLFLVAGLIALWTGDMEGLTLGMAFLRPLSLEPEMTGKAPAYTQKLFAVGDVGYGCGDREVAEALAVSQTFFSAAMSQDSPNYWSREEEADARRLAMHEIRWARQAGATIWCGLLYGPEGNVKGAVHFCLTSRFSYDEFAYSIDEIYLAGPGCGDLVVELLLDLLAHAAGTAKAWISVEARLSLDAISLFERLGVEHLLYEGRLRSSAAEILALAEKPPAEWEPREADEGGEEQPRKRSGFSWRRRSSHGHSHWEKAKARAKGMGRPIPIITTSSVNSPSPTWYHSI
jgi:hypothetical protein